MSILKFFSSANYLPVNLCVARELGLETAVLLGELVSEHEFWESQGKLRADGYFYATVEKIEARTTLSKHKQLCAIEKLQSLGLIEVALKGMPSKRHFKINLGKLCEFFSLPRQQSNLNEPKNEPKKFSTSAPTNDNIDNTECVDNIEKTSFQQSGDIPCESGNPGDRCSKNRITPRCSIFEHQGVQFLNTNKNNIYKNTNNILYNSSVENFENSIDVESPNKLENWRNDYGTANIGTEKYISSRKGQNNSKKHQLGSAKRSVNSDIR